MISINPILNQHNENVREEKNKNSTWKKELFRQENNRENTLDENFQIMNMEYKIKKIRKQRNQKLPVMENFKNIELFETLDSNLPETFETPSLAVLKPSTLPVVENFDECKDYDGMEDDPKCNKDKETDDPRLILANKINAIYDGVDRFNYRNAKYIAKVLSNNTQTHNDILLLKKYISLFESAGLSYFFAYNLFFVLFYIFENGKTVLEDIPRIDTIQMKNDSVKNKALGMFNFFFMFSVFFPEALQNMVYSYAPWLKQFFNYSTLFILLFLAIFYFMENFLTLFRDMLLAIVKGETSNMLTNLMFAFLVFNIFAVSFVIFDPRTPAYSLDFISKLKGFTIVLVLIAAICQFIIILIISVPFGMAFLIMLLFFWFTYLIPYTISTGDILDIPMFLKNITYFIEKNNKINLDGKTGPDGEMSFWNKCKYVLNNITDFLYSYILHIVYLVILCVALNDYIYNISSFNLRNSLGSISVTLIIMVMTLCIIGYIRKTNMDRTEKSPVPQALVEENAKGLMSALGALGK
jgi:hypothetical protein